jgi:hypothetical protein
MSRLCLLITAYRLVFVSSLFDGCSPVWAYRKSGPSIYSPSVSRKALNASPGISPPVIRIDRIFVDGFGAEPRTTINRGPRSRMFT